MTPAAELVKGREARAALPAPLTIAAGRQHTAETILRAWREGKSENTVRSYQHDLEDFALYLSRALGVSPPFDVNDALSRLFEQSAPSAHEVVLGFRSWMLSAHLSAASINRHLATLRSVSKLGRMLGTVNGGWHLEVPGVKAEKRRNTTGPTVADVRRMLDATNGATEGETRDYAIVLLFYCLGLRVSELCGLNLEDTDLARGTTWIRGKGRRERELVPLPKPVVEAIQRYLVTSGRQVMPSGSQRRYNTNRGTTAGSLFQSRGQRGKHCDGRLEARSVLRIVRELGQKVGLHVWCHSLRHTSITQAAELGQRAGLGLDKIRAHSRHRSIATLMLYVDEHDRQKTQQTLADLVAASIAVNEP